MEYSIADLMKWNKKIEAVIESEGLSCYPQEFEICSYEDMLCYEAYTGMPSHYPHWSFGKAYDKQKTLYQYDLTGLPYEMVINSNPCIAYLMRDNSLLLQILTMAHVYGHNDFFKNNRLFVKGTNADTTIEMFKNHAKRIRSYIGDPTIGYSKVERILDAIHGIRYHISRRIGQKLQSDKEIKQRLLNRYYEQTKRNSLIDDKKEIPFPDLNKVPLEATENIVDVIIQYGNLEEWEKDIVTIVSEETQYFLPQIETKIMNEGWASYWHYKILNKLDLPQGFHMEFLNRHNQVIKPFKGRINPYHLGFKLFEDIEKRYGKEKLFEARILERDASFVLKYLTREMCVEMNLFQYAKSYNVYVIEEISDEEGWKKIRNNIVDTVGLGNIPYIEVEDVARKEHILLLVHKYDGRELELNYAIETIKYICDLWGGKVLLKTIIDNEEKMIKCEENNRVTVSKA